MSTEPSAPEPGAVNNDGDCEIINGGTENDAGDGVEESKGDESASVTSAVQQSQADFVVPEGFIRIYGEKRNPSNMYKLGVRLESTTDVAKNGAREGRWYCMFNSECRRASNTFIRIKSSNTAPATTHLKALHGITSKRGDAIVKR
eukprot:jgi/Undpi1/5672/HiC_scaffold_2.g00946.m1